MTCREKLKLEHPECIGTIFDGGCQHCPHTYGYLPDPGTDFCAHTECYDCWDREVPENDSIEGKFTIATPVIKDSGDRTEFATGAVRDMREGKGRCDLMPLEVVSYMLSEVYNPRGGKQSIIVRCILDFKDSGETRYLYSALMHFREMAFSSSNETMLLEVAKHFEEGAKKYGENNWQKGIPAKCYIDSALRHYFKWSRGDEDERHDRAFVWNLMCCIWEVDYRPKEEKDESV